MVFERKLLRKIFGPTKERDGTWRIKTNDELDKLMRHKNIISGFGGLGVACWPLVPKFAGSNPA